MWLIQLSGTLWIEDLLIRVQLLVKDWPKKVNLRYNFGQVVNLHFLRSTEPFIAMGSIN